MQSTQVSPAPEATGCAAELDGYSELDLARILGKKPVTLRNWRAAEKGPPYTKIGALIVYPKAKFREWLESRTIEPEATGTLIHGRRRRGARHG